DGKHLVPRLHAGVGNAQREEYITRMRGLAIGGLEERNGVRVATVVDGAHARVQQVRRLVIFRVRKNVRIDGRNGGGVTRELQHAGEAGTRGGVVRVVLQVFLEVGGGLGGHGCLR